jgi:tetratricopeptide (TPR) repeat protein
MQRSLAVPVALLLLLPGLTGCNKIKARAELKQGNAMYENEQYKAALKQYQIGLELDPEATFAWRSVGLSALALYKPGENSPQNNQYAQTATDAFEKYLAAYPDDEKVRDYLLSTYVNAKMYDKAMAYLDEQAKNQPNKPELKSAKVRLMIQSGNLPEAAKLAQSYQGPNRHEILATIGIEAWNKAYNDPTLDTATRTEMVDMGLATLEQALKDKPDYFQGLVYYNLLLREKAKMETDANRKMELLAKADEYQKKAQVIGKKMQEEQKAAQAKKS